MALLLCLLAFSISYIGYLLGMDLICTDCLSRAWFAYNWSIHPQVHQVLFWLPMNDYIFGTILKIFPVSPVLTIHLINSAATAGTVYLSFQLAYFISQDFAPAIFATLIAFIYPMRIWFGFSMLSEPLYTFIFFVFVIQLTKMYRDKNAIHILWAFLLSLVLASYRYNAWLAMIGAVLFIFFGFQSRRLFFVSLLFFAGPLFWLGFNAHEYGDPFHVFASFKTDSSAINPDQTKEGFLLLGNFLKCNIPSFIGCILLAWSYKKRHVYSKVICLSLLLIAFDLVTAWGNVPTVFPIRTFCASGTLFLVIVSIFIFQVCSPKLKILFLVITIVHSVYLLGNLKHEINSIPVSAIEMGKRIGRSENFLQSKPASIAIDLEGVEAMAFTLFSSDPAKFAQMRMDPQTNSMIIGGDPNQIGLFISKNQQLADNIHALWKESEKKYIAPYWFVGIHIDRWITNS